MQIRSVLLAFLCISLTRCLYSSNSPVIQLTDRDFSSRVIKSNELWLVEFYAPWCGHCKQFSPEYEKVAKAFEGIVKIAAVDCDVNKAVAGEQNISSLPTIKFFGLNKQNPIDFSQQRTAKAVADFVISQLRSAVESRLSGNDGSSRSKSSSDSQKEGSSSGKSKDKGTGSGNPGHPNLYDLTDANFDQKVTPNSNWMIMFYAPWCGHCKRAMPDFEDASGKTKDKVFFGRINCDEAKGLCSKYGVQGFPTIKFFTDGSNIPYEGARDAGSFAEFAMSKVGSQVKRLELTQLTNQDVFNEYCVESEGLCIIALLPDIQDSGETKRMEYIKELKEISEENSRNPITFLWAQGGDHFPLEEKLNLNFGTPAMVAIHTGKKKYAIMRKKYEKKSIENFIGSLMAGSVGVNDLPELPKLKEKKSSGSKKTSEDL